MFRFGTVLALLGALASCAPVRMQEAASRPPGEAQAGIGEVMLRISLRDNLPDEFGGADILGRTRDRGFVELRYLGLDPEGHPTFRRRELEIDTNETVFHHAPARTTTTYSGQTSPARPSSSAWSSPFWQPAGSQSFAGRATTTTSAPSAPRVSNRGDETTFTLDLAQPRSLTLRGRSLQILDADATSVRFLVGPEQAAPGG